MVAKIRIKDALKTNFYYNENKVQQGVATCLTAENYPKDLLHLSRPERLKMLQKTASMNEAVKVNSVHISLSFDPFENLADEKLTAIAKAYMERIGFGEQPYLVYRHFDASHPHIHILSVKVRMDGSNIDTHHIGVKLSEPARKELERQFGLVRAEDSPKNVNQIKPAYAQKVQYGKMESRRAIANVLAAVIMQYNYTSLPEFNALLGQYNVVADRCRETSRVYKNNGLLYRIIDNKGKPVGVPIKASLFHNKPGLKLLGQRFILNEQNRQPLKKHTRNIIDRYFLKQPNPSLENFIRILEKEGVHPVIRRNEAGFIYGITFVDHRNKAVFNGSDLGKAYSAKSIIEKCNVDNQSGAGQMRSQDIPKDTAAPHTANEMPVATEIYNSGNDKGLLEILMQPEDSYVPVPYQLKKTRKKKKIRRLPDNQ